MEVSVEFSAKLEAGIEQYGFQLDPLRADLEAYFSGIKKPPYLGKDAPFERPDGIEEAEVHHLHVFVEGISCPDTWEKKKTSDSYIVYTYGYMNEDAHLIMAIIKDDAHEKCRNHSTMRDFKKVAEDFREKC
tara:strand:- start:920 stop:1315 length:396 start_codon:yes stop_codon:yes gene_type:complete